MYMIIDDEYIHYTKTFLKRELKKGRVVNSFFGDPPKIT